LKRKENGRKVYCSVQSSSSGSGPPPAWPGRAIPELANKTWEGPKPISIVGCTGSIGTQVLLAIYTLLSKLIFCVIISASFVRKNHLCIWYFMFISLKLIYEIFLVC
jgi:hypothetical protein